MKKILFGFVVAIMSAGVAHAFCPVCTVGVAAGLEGARILGVSDLITGLWAGGLMLSLAAWTESYMRKHGINNPVLILFNYVMNLWYPLKTLQLQAGSVLGKLLMVSVFPDLALIYVLPLGHPTLRFNATTLWGVDQFLLGVVVGSLTFLAAGKWYEYIKAHNGGHAWFPFQKVVWPLGALIIVTLIFWAILN